MHPPPSFYMLYSQELIPAAFCGNSPRSPGTAYEYGELKCLGSYTPPGESLGKERKVQDYEREAPLTQGRIYCEVGLLSKASQGNHADVGSPLKRSLYLVSSSPLAWFHHSSEHTPLLRICFWGTQIKKEGWRESCLVTRRRGREIRRQLIIHRLLTLSRPCTRHFTFIISWDLPQGQLIHLSYHLDTLKESRKLRWRNTRTSTQMIPCPAVITSDLRRRFSHSVLLLPKVIIINIYWAFMTMCQSTLCVCECVCVILNCLWPYIL